MYKCVESKIIVIFLLSSVLSFPFGKHSCPEGLLRKKNGVAVLTMGLFGETFP